MGRHGRERGRARVPHARSDAVVCADTAHIHTDEAGAPERMAGTKLLALPATDGKLHPSNCATPPRWLGDEHHPQARVLSITQSTESGTLYSADEIGALCDEAHRLGMLVHLDGARIVNAAAALGGDVRSFTIDAGVDVISFGGTKNGLMYGEAVVFCRPELAARAAHVRKQLGQLPSKVRYISAQFLAILADGLWLRLAEHANAMAKQLATAVDAVPGVKAGAGAGRQQRVRRASRRRNRATRRSGASSTCGTAPQPGALDDGVGQPPADIDAFVAGLRVVAARVRNG